jgi:hypothetical protein
MMVHKIIAALVAAILAQNNIAFAKESTTGSSMTSTDTGKKDTTVVKSDNVKKTPKDTGSGSSGSSSGGSGGNGDNGDVVVREPVAGNPTSPSNPKQTVNSIPKEASIEHCQTQGAATVVKTKCKTPITHTTTPPPKPITTPTTTPTTVHCPKGTHNVITLGCVKNHLTKKEAFGLLQNGI